MRDPSGIINRGDWTRQKEFWSMVNQRIEGYLVKQIRSRVRLQESACENTGDI